MSLAKIIDHKDYQGPTSRHWSVIVDLDAKDSYSQKMYFDTLSCKTIAVSIQLVKATGTSGTALGGQAVSHRGKIAPLDPVVSLPTVNDDTVMYFAEQVLGRYFVLDLSPLTLGVTGKIEIHVVAKPH